MNPPSVSRRDFLVASTTASLAAAASTASPTVLAASPSAQPARDPGRKLRIGLIGCGWYGMVDVEAAFRVGNVEVPILCDVDRDHLEASAAKVEKLQGRRPRTVSDHEELLKVDGLDAVIIATPPHWHALQLIAAVERGLDVYCEKPLSYDIREGRAMADAVRRSGRIVQIGFQRRQSPCFRAVRDHVRAGHAGRIVCAEANIHYAAGTQDPTPQDPPPGLDWDRWCGPGPRIPYSPQVGHFNWRLEKTSGQGHLVDWGIHLIDAARFILGEDAPRAVTATGGLYELAGKITTPDILTAQFEFASCPLTWRHRIWGAEEYAPEVSNGLFFYGDKQTVFVTDDRWIIIPRGRGREREVKEAKADAGQRHMEDFLAAVRERRPPGCVIEDGYRSTLAVKLAMIAYDTGTRVTWDGARERIVDNPAASALLKRPYRRPWRHPYHG